jgi:glycosyltransferase involved in cell wall biosynthesis
MMGGGSRRVSVVMPVYNGEPYLADCLDSVLGQTFEDFELIAIDDGSSDRSWEILTERATQDRRIRAIRHAQNRGHHRTSNEAIAAAEGAYLARMDQDDLWMPRRLEASVSFLDAHPDVGLLGTAYVRLLPDGRRIERQPPRTHTKIRAHQVFGNVVCHPAVTLRRELVATGELHYRDVRGPQDYDLWCRLLEHTRAATIPEPLVTYRLHEASMSGLFRDELPRAAEEISDRELRKLLGPGVDDAALRAVRHLFSSAGARAPAEYAHAGLVFEAFAAMERWPGADRDDLREMRRKWCRRALTAALSHGRTAATPLLRQVAAHEPTVLGAWLARDVPRRAASVVRHRGGHQPRLAAVE